MLWLLLHQVRSLILNWFATYSVPIETPSFIFQHSGKKADILFFSCIINWLSLNGWKDVKSFPFFSLYFLSLFYSFLVAWIGFSSIYFNQIFSFFCPFLLLNNCLYIQSLIESLKLRYLLWKERRKFGLTN
jgi:hypothetical protein